jgi:hypothetical protein
MGMNRWAVGASESNGVVDAWSLFTFSLVTMMMPFVPVTSRGKTVSEICGYVTPFRASYLNVGVFESSQTSPTLSNRPHHTMTLLNFIHRLVDRALEWVNIVNKREVGWLNVDRKVP